MADTIRIDPTQSAIWATEDTLRKLLQTSDVGVDLLSKVLGKTYSKEQLDVLKSSAKSGDKNAEQLLSGLDRLGNRNEKSYNDAIKDLKGSLTSSFRQLSSGLTGGGADSLVGALSGASKTAGKSLRELSDTLPGAARGITKLGGAALGVVGVLLGMWTNVSRLIDNFGTLYDSGINLEGGLKGVTSMAQDLQISSTELAGILTKFGGTVNSMGIDQTRKLGKEFLRLTSNGAEFHMGQTEALEAVLSYAEMVRTTRNLEMKTADDFLMLAKNAETFNRELTLTAAVTGKSRKETERQLKETLKKTEIAALFKDLSPEMQKLMETKMMPGLAALGKGGEDFGQAMILASGRQGLAGLQRLAPDLFQKMNLGGFIPLISEYSEKLRSGTLTAEERSNIEARLSQTIKRAATTQKDLMSSSNSAAMGLQEYALELDRNTPAIAKREADITAIMKKEGIDRTEAEKKYSASRAKTEKEVQNELNAATKNVIETMNQLSVDVIKPLLPALKLVASAVSGLANMFVKLQEALTNFLSWFPFGTTTTKKPDGTEETKAAGWAESGGALGALGLGYLGYRGVKAGAGRLRRGKGKPELTTPELVPEAPGAPGAKSKLRRLRAGMRAGGPAAIAGLGLDLAGSAASATGYEKTGAALSVGGSAATYAGLGAMLGSVVPGLGTAAGAIAGGALGGAIGLWQNWSELFGKETAGAGAAGTGLGFDPKQIELLKSLTPEIEKFRSGIESLSDSAPKLDLFNTNLAKLTETYAKTVKVFENPISGAGLDSLSRLNRILSQTANQPGMLDRATSYLGIGGAEPGAAAGGVASVLTRRTMQYYDDQKYANDKIIELLDRAAVALEDKLTAIENASRDQTRAIGNIGQLRP